jgi:hypothetical protein
MWQRVTLVDRNSVTHTIIRIEHNVSVPTRAVRGKHCLDSDMEGRDIEGFELKLNQLFTVGLPVAGSFSEKQWMLNLINRKFVVEGVVTDFSISSQLVTMPCSIGYPEIPSFRAFSTLRITLKKLNDHGF